MTLDMRLVLAFLVAATLPALSACDGAESEATLETGGMTGLVTITMTEDSCDYEGPTSIGDRKLTVELLKETDSDGTFELLRITEGTTFDELEARIDADGERIAEGLEPVGYQSLASLEVSAELIGAGDRQRLLRPLRLEPGPHAFLCIQEAGLGLAGPLEVTP